MKIRCPRCQQPCGVFRRTCELCGFALTVPSLWRFAVRRTWAAAAVECPHCRSGALPVGVNVCPNCGSAPTFRDTVRAAFDPHCQRVRRFFEDVPPFVKWLAQWVYLLCSAWLLWWALGDVDRRTGGHWFGTAVISVIHMAAIGFFTVWLMPRRLLFAISRNATGKVKLSLSLNVLAGMVMMQLGISIWWQRTTLLATIFVVLWLAARLLNEYVLPEAWLIHRALFGAGNHFETDSPQGRSARYD
jgi:hypothetical protein